MAKIFPQGHQHSSDGPSANPYSKSQRGTLTIWIKSLILNGNGCTVFDASGHIVYRVDNCNCKSSKEVHLMDVKGNVLFTILMRKKLNLFIKLWEGYRSTTRAEIYKAKPDFRLIRKTFKMLRGYSSACKVIIGLDNNRWCDYRIEDWTKKTSSFKIVDKVGGVLSTTDCCIGLIVSH